jgi:L-malate glycosyltransferase
MIVSFLSPTTPYPIGGVAVIFEFANALTARGHTVQILHHGIFGKSVSSLGEIGWFDFDPDVVHFFFGLDDPDSDSVPSADIFFGHAPEGLMRERFGLPVVLIQGAGMLSQEVEGYAFQAPCPKVCVASWLIGVGTDEYSMPPEQFVHVAPGLHLDRFKVSTPIAERGRTVTFLHSTHPTKGTGVAIAALAEVRRRVPDVEVRSFGTFELDSAFPTWITHTPSPGQQVLIDEIYNRSAIFVCASFLEGFGLPLVEAMACGAALVTTANGGADDYAIHQRTALVSEPGDIAALADHVVRLLDHEDERVRLATAGTAFVQGYTWPSAAEKLEAFLLDYLAAPSRYAVPDHASSGPEAARTNFP